MKANTKILKAMHKHEQALLKQISKANHGGQGYIPPMRPMLSKTTINAQDRLEKAGVIYFRNAANFTNPRRGWWVRSIWENIQDEKRAPRNP